MLKGGDADLPEAVPPGGGQQGGFQVLPLGGLGGQDVFATLGLGSVVLEINSLGCKECRKAYVKALLEYFGQYRDPPAAG